MPLHTLCKSIAPPIPHSPITNMDARFHNLLVASETLPPMTPYQISTLLTTFIDHIPNSIHQLAIIAYAAIGQHQRDSPFAHLDIVGGGVPLYCRRQDVEFQKADAEASLGEYLNGWPVNVAFHNGECFMHFKYFGVTLSNEGDGDLLNRFMVPPTGTSGWSDDDIKCLVRGVYVMFRNLLNAGLSIDYLKRVMQLQISRIVSPFAYRFDALPINIAYADGLLATDAIVEDTLAFGAYEILDDQCQAEAGMIHAFFQNASVLPRSF